MLIQLTDAIQVQNILRNVVEYAVDDGLLSIKTALEPFWDPPGKVKGKVNCGE
jgi:hypothetical protein